MNTARPEPNLSSIPNIKGAAGAAEWVTKKLGIEMSKDHILYKSKTRDIQYSLIRGSRYYSSQALFDYIMSCNKTDASPAAKLPSQWEA